jgi:hypothetical protein
MKRNFRLTFETGVGVQVRSQAARAIEALGAFGTDVASVWIITLIG